VRWWPRPVGADPGPADLGDPPGPAPKGSPPGRPGGRLLTGIARCGNCGDPCGLPGSMTRAGGGNATPVCAAPARPLRQPHRDQRPAGHPGARRGAPSPGRPWPGPGRRHLAGDDREQAQAARDLADAENRKETGRGPVRRRGDLSPGMDGRTDKAEERVRVARRILDRHAGPLADLPSSETALRQAWEAAASPGGAPYSPQSWRASPSPPRRVRQPVRPQPGQHHLAGLIGPQHPDTRPVAVGWAIRWVNRWVSRADTGPKPRKQRARPPDRRFRRVDRWRLVGRHRPETPFSPPGRPVPGSPADSPAMTARSPVFAPSTARRILLRRRRPLRFPRVRRWGPLTGVRAGATDPADQRRTSLRPQRSRAPGPPPSGLGPRSPLVGGRSRSRNL